MNESTRSHSVILDENECKGCTVCVTTCPTEAIRVRSGKACILDERCIDCGECIRRCPNHAKKARSLDTSLLGIPGTGSDFEYVIALPAPSLYGQFPSRYSIGDIHSALLSLGFDAVFPVASATPFIARETRELLGKKEGTEPNRPLISSSCPTIIKFIQIRFPTLLGHIAPVIAPMELAGRLARKEAKKTGKRIGVFFISPCAGKITESSSPIGNEKSTIDGVFSMKDIYLPMLCALSKMESEGKSVEIGAEEIAWGHAGGEAEATVSLSGHTYLAVDGMDQCRKILETVEDGKLGMIDFLELMACTGGCVGGPLSPTNPALARFTITQRKKGFAHSSAPLTEAHPEKPSGAKCADRLRTKEFPARPALLLDSDFQKALRMMATMEEIYEGLPGLDCGCCGAPNCHALAEDIVRGNANRTDCVIILKEQYRALLESGKTDLK